MTIRSGEITIRGARGAGRELGLRVTTEPSLDAHLATDIDDAARARLSAWISEHIKPTKVFSLCKFSGGQSNPTYLVTTDAGNLVLRRKPFGVLLPKAHMIEREFSVLRALADTGVPVPKVVGLCEDATVIGAAFYLMQCVEGRIFWDPSLPGLSNQERAGIFSAMGDTVAQLHAVRPSDVGLEKFGRAQGFVARQIALWTTQYRAAQTHDIPAMDRLIEWLPQQVREEDAAPAIFHGDLRLDNMIFHPTEPRVLALLDWELSTLGDPLADFAYHAMIWRIPPDIFRGLGGVDLPSLGIPSEQEYIARYLNSTGRASIPNWEFYLVFSMFRIASILQGVAKRARDGNASAANAAELGARTTPLADLGWGIARAARGHGS